MNPGFWKGKRVFLTGHTGFKGSWLAIILAQLGAKVTGYALAAESDRQIFVSANVAARTTSIIGDLRDAAALTQALREAKPDMVFHLAAQSLVRRSYGDPLGTYATNIMGTANLLEAARGVPEIRAIVVATSDKCYENLETGRAYRESDPLGGYDPYSSSKAAAEIVTAAYRSSFFGKSETSIATVRAGNVVGGGDWCEDRLVPDLVRGVIAGTPTQIRSPDAVRPWQHVLEPLSGYIAVAERLCGDKEGRPTALNFGPGENSAQPVRVVADMFCKFMGDGAVWQHAGGDHPHEAKLLQLDSSLAQKTLGWKPRWTLDQCLEATAEWYRAMIERKDLNKITERQIDAYFA
jgi:CDP-glucose 4,6-dehydratase